MLPEIPNHALDWSAPTSEGKTSGLRLAASVWGVPNEDAEDGRTVPPHLDQKTSVWIENACVRRPGLPLILDDTKKARSAEIVSRRSMRSRAGGAAGAGCATAARALKSYRTILLTTGEYPITTIGRVAHGGAVARVIERADRHWAGRTGQWAAGEAAQDGPAPAPRARGRAADPLAHGGAQEEALLADHRHYLLHWERLAGDDKIAGRAADYMAALSLGRDRRCGCWACLTVLARSAAWEAVLQHPPGRRGLDGHAGHALLGGRSGTGSRARSAARQQPSQGLLGVWDDAAGWAEPGIYPHELRGFLEGQGFEAPPRC